MDAAPFDSVEAAHDQAVKLRLPLLGAALFAIVVAVYSASIANDFVRYDDFDYIVKNEALENGLTRQAAKWSFLNVGYAGNYHPLAWISHALDISLARGLGIDYREDAEHRDIGLVTKQDGAFPHLVHAVAVLLHGANAVLLWWLMMAFAVRKGDREIASPSVALLAAGCALFWALHPLRVEVVAWASERKELLSVMFMLLTLIAYERGEEGKSTVRLFSPPRIFFLLALLAKPVAVSLPAVIFAWEWALRRRSFAEALRRVVPMAAMAAAFCVVTMIAQEDGLSGARELTVLQKVLSSVEAPVIYLMQTFWPVELSIDYALPDWSTWPLFAAGVVLLLAMAAAGGWFVWFRAYRRQEPRWLAWCVFAIAWGYVGLLPMLGVVKVGYEPHNDRYTYWIGCGAVFCLFVLLRRYVRFVEPHFRNVCIGTGAVLVVLSVLTFFQCRVWEDSESLFSRIVYKTWNEQFARILAEGIYFKDHSREAEAEEMLREVLARKHSPEARAALALQLATFGDGSYTVTAEGEKLAFVEARLLAAYALEEEGKGHDWAYAALAFADYREGKYKEAADLMQKALDCGFKSGFLKVDVAEWRKKAAEQEAKKAAGKDAEKDVQKP